MAAGMSGDVTIRGITANADADFSTILKNLKLGAMGKVRVSNDTWSLATDVIYMELGSSSHGVDIDLKQWVVEPTVGYRINPNVELLIGGRYNSIGGELRGPGVLPLPVIRTGTQEWIDPIIGANLRFPVNGKWSLNLRADIGGLSGFTWQAYPAASWQFSPTGSLQMGYRWVSNDHDTGSGANHFAYHVLSEGPQVGATFRF
jgi:hypothetical protein